MIYLLRAILSKIDMSIGSFSISPNQQQFNAKCSICPNLLHISSGSVKLFYCESKSLQIESYLLEVQIFKRKFLFLSLV